MEELVGDDVYFRRTGNLSAGGVFFDSAIPPIGHRNDTQIYVTGCKEMVVARGKVVSHTEKTDGLGMGVKFISFKATKRSAEIFYQAL